jgi:hypothetical protein
MQVWLDLGSIKMDRTRTKYLVVRFLMPGHLKHSPDAKMQKKWGFSDNLANAGEA